MELRGHGVIDLGSFSRKMTHIYVVDESGGLRWRGTSATDPEVFARTLAKKVALVRIEIVNIEHRDIGRKIGSVLVWGSVALVTAVTIWVLYLDTAIVEYGQIGFLTVILYYGIYVPVSVAFWVGIYLTRPSAKSRLVIWIWVLFGVWPLLPSVYGYDGPRRGVISDSWKLQESWGAVYLIIEPPAHSELKRKPPGY